MLKNNIFVPISLGGALGALLRYWVSGLSYRFFGFSFPWGTLAVNCLGAFVIGFLWIWFESVLVSVQLRLFIFVGILGALTTFSTYSLETLNLFREGESLRAFLNIVINNSGALSLAWLGMSLSRYILKLVK